MRLLPVSCANVCADAASARQGGGGEWDRAGAGLSGGEIELKTRSMVAVDGPPPEQL
jgi:hypothetical protein